MELGNHSEFLNQMNFKNMLSMYFINDMNTVQKWRLKGHAEDLFWKFVASWSVCFTCPEDLGFKSEKHKLPKLNIIEHPLVTEKVDNGSLFNDVSVSSTNHNRELKRTFDIRMQKTIELSQGLDQFIVWVKHNEESKYLADNIEGALEVTGSMSDNLKKERLLGFFKGDFRVLVTKAKIAQYGLNYQNCFNQVFPSPDFSFEGMYQCMKRSHRFGQENDVNIHIITTDTMRNVIESISRKQEQFLIMRNKLSEYANI